MHRSIALFLVLAAACGSDHKAKADGPPAADAPPAKPTAVVVAGDFTAGHPGTLAVVDVQAKTIATNAAPAGAVGDDPVIKHVGSELLIVNRNDGNNVTILDDKTRGLIMQLATGASSNPQDVAVGSDGKLYVPVFGGKGVAVLTRGSQTIQTIDLSVDDPDGKPNCIAATFVGSQLYVACELLDNTNTNLPPRGPGKVYVVDPGTGQIVHTVTMQTENPVGLFATLPSGDLAIPSVNYATMAGCIEKITTGATPASGGCLAQNSDLKGYGAGLAVQNTAILWTTVSAFDFVHANLQAYDLTTKMLWPAPITPTGEAIVAAAVCPDTELAVVDSTMTASGVRLYSNAQEVTSAPLSAGLRTQSANSIVCY
jgi:hypothetical protein